MDDTILQVRDPGGDWEDLGRDTRATVQTVVERGSIPGLTFQVGAELRGVDWLSWEEVIPPRPAR